MENIDDKIVKLERFKSIDTLDSVVLGVIDKITSRAIVGKNKYNTDMDREYLNIVEWINHAQEEMMDYLIYMEKIKKELVKRNIDNLK